MGLDGVAHGCPPGPEVNVRDFQQLRQKEEVQERKIRKF